MIATIPTKEEPQFITATSPSAFMAYMAKQTKTHPHSQPGRRAKLFSVPRPKLANEWRSSLDAVGHDYPSDAVFEASHTDLKNDRNLIELTHDSWPLIPFSNRLEIVHPGDSYKRAKRFRAKRFIIEHGFVARVSREVQEHPDLGWIELLRLRGYKLPADARFESSRSIDSRKEYEVEVFSTEFAPVHKAQLAPLVGRLKKLPDPDQFEVNLIIL